MLKSSFSISNSVQVGRIFLPMEAITIDRYVYYRSDIAFAVVRKYSKLDFEDRNFENPKEEKVGSDWPNNVATLVSEITDKKLKYISGEYVVISAAGKSHTRDFYEAWDKLR